MWIAAYEIFNIHQIAVQTVDASLKYANTCIAL